MNSKLKSIIVTTLCAVTLGFGLSGSVYAEQTTAVETTPSVTYQTQIQNVGWQDYVQMGDMSGTKGESLRLEGIRIKLNTGSYDLGIEYQTHIQNIGWEAEEGLGLKTSGQFSGTEGKSWRLEGIKINLTGADADKFDILYKTHIQNVGWEKEWKKNGEMSGTKGQSLRLEGIYIKIAAKDVVTPDPVEPDPASLADPRDINKDGLLDQDELNKWEEEKIGDLSWDKNRDSLLDENEKEDWRKIPAQTPYDPTKPWDINRNSIPDPNEQAALIKWVDDNHGVIDETKNNIAANNPPYKPWVINLPQTAHKHQWTPHTAINKVNGVTVYRWSPINIFSAKDKDPEKFYLNDVANGCKYNFVEWCYGYGNSYYPNGIENSDVFGNITVAQLLGNGSIYIDEDALGHPQAEFSNEENNWASAHMYIDYYFCTTCGETRETYESLIQQVSK